MTLLIAIARKPTVEPNIVANALEWGTSGINVDGCRIRGHVSDVPKKRGTNTFGLLNDDGWVPHPSDFYPHASGRWPANLLLQHLPTCTHIGTTEEPGYVINRWKDGSKPFGGGAGHPYEGSQTKASSTDVWECQHGCPVGTLDEQVGPLTSGSGCFMRKSSKDGWGNRSAAYGKESRPAGAEQISYGDTGYASRFFKQFKADNGVE